MTYVSRLAVLSALLLPGAAAAQARPPLGEVEVVTEGLIDIALAYEIDRVCEELDGRRMQGIAQLWSLYGEARSLGYSRAEVEAFVDNDAEKDRLEGIARARLREMGAMEGRPETYCEVGRDEIAKNSRIGGLLSD
jgi:hypothetical protein